MSARPPAVRRHRRDQGLDAAMRQRWGQQWRKEAAQGLFALPCPCLAVRRSVCFHREGA